MCPHPLHLAVVELSEEVRKQVGGNHGMARLVGPGALVPGDDDRTEAALPDYPALEQSDFLKLASNATLPCQLLRDVPCPVPSICPGWRVCKASTLQQQEEEGGCSAAQVELRTRRVTLAFCWLCAGAMGAHAHREGSECPLWHECHRFATTVLMHEPSTYLSLWTHGEPQCPSFPFNLV